MSENFQGREATLLLASLRPNDWNPNRLTPRQYASLKYGLEKEGWYSSQKLLVWGTDNKGVLRNIIIDGENRWRAAREVGYEQGPAVVLDGLTEAQAKALTIKLDNKRGTFDNNLLSKLVQQLAEDGSDNLALELGFTDEEFVKLTTVPGEEELIEELDEDEVERPVASEGVGGEVVSHNEVTKMVPLYLEEKDHVILMERVRVIIGQSELKTVSDAVLKAVEDEAALL